MARRVIPLAALALALAGMGAGGALAQTAPADAVAAPTILTLDQDRLYTQSMFGKRLEKSSSDAVTRLSAENHQIETDLAAEEKVLTDQRAKLTAAEFKPLAEAFDAKVERIRAEQGAKSKAVQDARDTGRKAFFQAALPVLADLMRQRGAFAILNKGAVILSFDALDVTDAAIAAIDAKLGDGSNTAAPPPTAPTPAPAPVAPGQATGP